MNFTLHQVKLALGTRDDYFPYIFNTRQNVTHRVNQTTELV